MGTKNGKRKDGRTTVAIADRLHKAVTADAFMRTQVQDRKVTVREVIDDIIAKHYDMIETEEAASNG